MCSFFECYIYTYVLVKVVALFLCCKKNYFSVPSYCKICQCELEQGYNKRFKIKSDHYVTLCCECLKNSYLSNKQVYIFIYTTKTMNECVL